MLQVPKVLTGRRARNQTPTSPVESHQVLVPRGFEGVVLCVVATRQIADSVASGPRAPAPSQPV
jgi:hypothetical protein